MTGRWQCHHNDASSRLLRCHAPRATGLREGMGDTDQQDDVALLRAIATNPLALEQFYRRHVGDVTHFLSRRCRTPEDLADAVSATFVAV